MELVQLLEIAETASIECNVTAMWTSSNIKMDGILQVPVAQGTSQWRTHVMIIPVSHKPSGNMRIRVRLTMGPLIMVVVAILAP